MKRPDDLELSQAQGKALIDRLEANQITSEDRRVLVKLIEVYFWLTAALRESKLSLKRLKRRLFGEGAKPREPPSGDDDGPGGDIGSTNTATPTSASAPLPSDPPAEPSARRGHGRQAAAAYSGATVVACRHDRLSVGERCPACGRGRLYRLPPGMTIRIDGNALLTALRYEVEKLRCSACGEIFTAPLPPAAGVDKYTARAQAMVALARYYLGLPFYRLQGFQCLVGVPVSDATQWDLAEQVAECTAPVFNELVRQAAQREVLYQDDTGVRILALIAENRAAQAATEQGQGVSLERRGMYTTGLVASGGGPTICLYFSGRAHAGENLAAVLAHRDPALPLPIVMSDALAANTVDEDKRLIRANCLQHARQQVVDIQEAFPVECQRVMQTFQAVFEHEATTRSQGMSAAERLRYHQEHSELLLKELKAWLNGQLADKLVEPNSSLGAALNYLQTHWLKLTRFLSMPGVPIDNSTVERALKLRIRQRKNSLFFATVHGATVGSLLTSIIATCAECGVNALEYLVALLTHRRAVAVNPAAWLPWCYLDTVAQATCRQSAAILA